MSPSVYWFHEDSDFTRAQGKEVNPKNKTKTLIMCFLFLEIDDIQKMSTLFKENPVMTLSERKCVYLPHIHAFLR